MILSSLILILFIGGLVALLSEKVSAGLPKWVAVATLLLAWIPVYPLFSAGQPATDAYWLAEESHVWISSFNIQYHVGADGLSLLLIGLSLAVGLVAVGSAWKENPHHSGFFFLNILWTLAGVVGVFVAMDLFLFFVFWEAMLIPVYFLMVIWGKQDCRQAALKFFLYTQAGGLLMLVSIIALVLLHFASTGIFSFDYNDLIHHQLTGTAVLLIMLGFLVSFAIKLPVFPFHNWQADAYAQAPTAATILMAAVMSKMGGYGIIRFVLPLFPFTLQEVAPYAMALACITIVYGAVLAFAQDELKRLIAYSSLSHMGFVLLGCFALNTYAWQGAVMQMLAHGFSTAALFLLAAAIEQRYQTTDLARLGGLWQTAPKLGAFGLFFVAASLGMPGLGNFVAEFLVLLGSFGSYPIFTAIAASALVIGAAYSLRLAQRTLFGPLQAPPTADLDAREVLLMLSLAAALIYLGLHPQPFMDMAQQTLDQFPLASLTAGVQP